MDHVNREYITRCNTPSDINEHLPTLARYAEECSTVAEFGMRSVISTWALLYGLLKSPGTNKRLLSLDLNYSPGIENVKNLCNHLCIDFFFIMGNDILYSLEPTDLLFIDTWHIYGHLKRELEKHHSQVNKYILLNDTTVDAIVGETIRNGWDPVAQSKTCGYPIEEITKGLWPAVEEFLAAHPEWVLEHRYKNNNGLTVLKRV